MADYINKADVYKLFEGTNGVIRMHVAEVDQIPAADVAPVVHGRWEQFRMFEEFIMRCSCCQKVGLSYFGYCPYCGATMDADEVTT